jgi:hypothetical protein
VGQYDANDAELGFFQDLLHGGDDVVSKEAAALSPGTSDLLGIQTVSPKILKDLESQAEQPPDESQQSQSEPQPAEESAPAPEAQAKAPVEAAPAPAAPQPEVEESVDVGSAEPTDAEPEPDAEPPAEPDLPDRESHGKLFTNRRAHPLQIFDVLNMRYGQAWPEWEPDTVWWALRRDFGSVGEIARNKILALDVAASTDTPWIDWDTFENCGQSWNDFVPVFGSFQPMTPMQIAFAVQVLRGVRGEEEFSWEVNAYIAAVLEEHGWVYAPEEWFAGAQELLDRKDWLIGLRVDVADAWEKVKDIPPQEIEWEEDARSIHLLKMATVKSYLEGRAELRDEIPRASASAVTASQPVP